MDSITQFTLGAAVGEAVLGRKLGNKAVLIGGIFGTIPDLDVLLTPFYSDVMGLVIHRGYSHSIMFAVLFGLLSAWLLKKVVDLVQGPEISFSKYYLFTFLALFTHSLLDSFTTYGTQLFLPFSDFRVGINNIFVADPFYTVPFLILLIAAMRFPKSSSKRRWLNGLGIGISSAYMLFTLGAKVYTNHVFENVLSDRAYQYERFTSSPTPLNAFLWSVTAETDEGYVTGMYSIFDQDCDVELFELKKDPALRAQFNGQRDFGILTWFSDDYYLLTQREGYVAYYDLRFGPIDFTNINREKYPFYFMLSFADGALNVSEMLEPPQLDEPIGEYFKRFVCRVLGNKS